jgi:glycosyltransferase involved in cell wall biosynthesis
VSQASTTIAVLMTTYNGDRYVSEQVQSILEQSWTRWQLVIRDDGSQDNTISSTSNFARRYPGRILVVDEGGPRLGVDASFSRLLELTESKYYMFCDQDDVWLPDKMERTLRCMRFVEAEVGEETPVLVHTDLRVVDADLREIDRSAWHYSNLNPRSSSQLNRLLVQNTVFGCTIMINGALRSMATPVPRDVVQYDWWLALVSSCFGRSSFIAEPTLMYRQHGNNTVGVQRWGMAYVIKKLGQFYAYDGPMASLAASRRQAAILLDRYRERLRSDDRDMIEQYANLEERGFLAKRRILFRYRLLKTGLIRNIGLFARI